MKKRPSARFRHEHEVRVKWNVTRGWRRRQCLSRMNDFGYPVVYFRAYPLA